MKDALARVLAAPTDTQDAHVDRVLAASFFRPRPMQAGTVASVVSLADRRPRSAT